MKEEIKDANRYVFIESSVALGVSLLINIAVTAVFAHGLHGKTNADVFHSCLAKNDSRLDLQSFSDDNEIFEADLYKAGIFLGCEFGVFSMYIWAIGIFAAGQSSTMTGTYSGQFVMEGFLNLEWSRWKRVLLTRSIAIAPTLAVTLTSDINHLTGMNDYLNALMSLQLPFALLPLLTFTSSKKVMGIFANGLANKLLASVLSVISISINIFFVIHLVAENFVGKLFILIIVGIFGIFYVIFIIYLICCYLVVLSDNRWSFSLRIGHYFTERNVIEYEYDTKQRVVFDKTISRAVSDTKL